MSDDDEPALVTDVVPTDISKIQDQGVRALVLLATSLGWSIIRREHNLRDLLGGKRG